MLKHNYIETLTSQSNVKLAGAGGCSELEDVRKKMIEQEKTFIETLKDLEKDLEECEDKEGKCKQELRAKEAEINNLKNKITECESRVSNKQNQIEELKDAEVLAKECKGQLQVKEEAIRAKEAEINNLKSKIKECESKNSNSELENKLSECNKKMESLLEEREKALKAKEDDNATAAKEKAEEEEANKKAGTIMPEEITLGHTEATNCGSYSGYYKNYSQVGRDAFYTYDILKGLHPAMFANPKIAPHIEKGAHDQYGAVNYVTLPRKSGEEVKPFLS